MLDIGYWMLDIEWQRSIPPLKRGLGGCNESDIGYLELGIRNLEYPTIEKPATSDK
jgi:hypothetical protein